MITGLPFQICSVIRGDILKIHRIVIIPKIKQRRTGFLEEDYKTQSIQTGSMLKTC